MAEQKALTPIVIEQPEEPEEPEALTPEEEKYIQMGQEAIQNIQKDNPIINTSLDQLDQGSIHLLTAIDLEKKINILFNTKPHDIKLIAPLIGLFSEYVKNQELIDTISDLQNAANSGNNEELIKLGFSGPEHFNEAIKALLPENASAVALAFEKIAKSPDNITGQSSNETGEPLVEETGEALVGKTGEAAAGATRESLVEPPAGAMTADEATQVVVPEAPTAGTADDATPVVVPVAPTAGTVDDATAAAAALPPDVTVVPEEQQGESMPGKGGGRRYKSKTRRKTRRTRRRRRTRKTNRKKRKTNRKKRRSNRKTRKM